MFDGALGLRSVCQLRSFSVDHVWFHGAKKSSGAIGEAKQVFGVIQLCWHSIAFLLISLMNLSYLDICHMDFFVCVFLFILSSMADKPTYLGICATTLQCWCSADSPLLFPRYFKICLENKYWQT